MGAALTYARRYALFTLVGIAGEDRISNHTGSVTLPRPHEALAGSEVNSASRTIVRSRCHCRLPITTRACRWRTSCICRKNGRRIALGDGSVQNLSHIWSGDGFGLRDLRLIERPHVHVALG